MWLFFSPTKALLLMINLLIILYRVDTCMHGHVRNVFFHFTIEENIFIILFTKSWLPMFFCSFHWGPTASDHTIENPQPSPTRNKYTDLWLRYSKTLASFFTAAFTTAWTSVRLEGFTARRFLMVLVVAQFSNFSMVTIGFSPISACNLFLISSALDIIAKFAFPVSLR